MGYRPWLRDYRNSFVALVIAACSTWIAMKFDRFDLGLAIGFPVALASVWFFKRARRRSYGKTLERSASTCAFEELTAIGFQVRTNVPAPGGGDLDMVIRGRNSTAIVEIKSWHGLDYGRKRQLVQQTRRQGKGKNLVLVWLPNAPAPEGLFAVFCDPSKLCDNTYLVKGSVQRLRRALRRCGVTPN